MQKIKRYLPLIAILSLSAAYFVYYTCNPFLYFRFGLYELIQKADIAFDPVLIGCQVFLKQIVVGTVNDPIVLE